MIILECDGAAPFTRVTCIVGGAIFIQAGVKARFFVIKRDRLQRGYRCVCRVGGEMVIAQSVKALWAL